MESQYLSPVGLNVLEIHTPDVKHAGKTHALPDLDVIIAKAYQNKFKLHKAWGKNPETSRMTRSDKKSMPTVTKNRKDKATLFDNKPIQGHLGAKAVLQGDPISPGEGGCRRPSHLPIINEQAYLSDHGTTDVRPSLSGKVVPPGLEETSEPQLSPFAPFNIHAFSETITSSVS